MDLFLGPGWERVGDLLLVLVPIGLFQTFVNPIGLCFQVTGKTRLFFAIGVAQTVATVLSFVIGVSMGSIDAVVAAYAIATLLISPLGMSYGLGTIGSGMRQWFLWCGPYLACLPLCWVANQSLNRSSTAIASVAIDALLIAVATGAVSVLMIRLAWNRENP